MAAVFPSFHSNRQLKTQNGGIFAFKSKQQCLLPKKSKFDALLKKLEISPAHCLKAIKVKLSMLNQIEFMGMNIRILAH